MNQVGFLLKEKRQGPYGSDAYAIDAGGTIFVLMNKALVEKFSPEVDLDMPSILFSVDDLDDAYQQLIDKHVNTSDIFELEGMRTFSFSDHEGHYARCS